MKDLLLAFNYNIKYFSLTLYIKNTKLGELVYPFSSLNSTDLAQNRCAIKFKLDNNGILEISLRHLATNKTKAITLTISVSYNHFET